MLLLLGLLIEKTLIPPKPKKTEQTHSSNRTQQTSSAHPLSLPTTVRFSQTKSPERWSQAASLYRRSPISLCITVTPKLLLKPQEHVRSGYYSDYGKAGGLCDSAPWLQSKLVLRCKWCTVPHRENLLWRFYSSEPIEMASVGIKLETAPIPIWQYVLCLTYWLDGYQHKNLPVLRTLRLPGLHWINSNSASQSKLRPLTSSIFWAMSRSLLYVLRIYGEHQANQSVLRILSAEILCDNAAM